MESTVALEMSHLWLEMLFIIGLIGGVSMLFLLFCLACVGSDFFGYESRGYRSLHKNIPYSMVCHGIDLTPGIGRQQGQGMIARERDLALDDFFIQGQ